MKQILKYRNRISGALLLGSLALTSCTDQFEKWNINPNEVTSEQMSQDNLNTGAFFTQMEKGVFIVGEDLGGEYQITEMLTGDIFASYIANINTYSYTSVHNGQYRLYQNWYNAPFTDAYKYIMQPWKSIKDVTDEDSPARAMATIIKVLGMSRITDMYGPIPYSKFGTSTKVAYDSQQDVYSQFFEELDHAIKALTTYSNNNTAKYMEDYDYIYSGNTTKWVKFANTLRLRLAMRISFVDKTKAETEAAEAINHSYGLMTSTDDSAILHQTASFTFTNPIWEVSESFQDMRMGATMDCYMNGYDDPRISRYFRTAADGAYHGVRNGMTSINKDSYSSATSGINVASGDGMQWMTASEAFFLMAEASLRLGLGNGSAQDYYEQGIVTSFAQWGASGAEAYIANDTSLPLASYKDPTTSYGGGSTSASDLSQLSPAWDNTAGDEVKLERIMIQKWIALFPNGQEAWSEMRRTDYPGFIKIYTYNGVTEVASGKLISRLKFPTTEYSNNTENINAAVSLLGGSDIAGTRLWWDVK